MRGISRLTSSFYFLGVILLAIAGEALGQGSSQLDGIWRTRGYGDIYVIDRGEVKAYEVTRETCIPSTTRFNRIGKSTNKAAVAELSFLRLNRSMSSDIFPGSNADEIILSPRPTVTKILADRIDQLPANCIEPVINTPQTNFDVLWHMFDEHYPFFEMKGVDWGAVRRKYRPRANASMSDRALFQLLVGMIEPLEDAHTGVKAEPLGEFFVGRRHETADLDDKMRGRIREIIEVHYIRGEVQKFCNDKIVFGALTPGTYYLGIDGFMNLGTEKKYAAELGCTKAAMDKVFVTPEKIKAMVLDVRLNSGGYDPLGNLIAGYLTRKSYLAYAKQAKLPGGWSQSQPVWISASKNPGFYGPVVLLAGSASESAAETFAMALMGRSPKIVRLGEHTQGIFSDTIMRGLPNSWVFAVPNEQYLTEKGRTFDGSGIPPDFAVPLFSEQDLFQNRDRALEMALELL